MINLLFNGVSVKKLLIVALCLAASSYAHIHAFADEGEIEIIQGTCFIQPRPKRERERPPRGPRTVTVRPPNLSQDSEIEKKRMSHLPSADLDAEAKNLQSSIQQGIALLQRQCLRLDINAEGQDVAQSQGSFDACTAEGERILAFMKQEEQEIKRCNKRLAIANQVIQEKQLAAANKVIEEEKRKPKKSALCSIQ